ncbi:uncharacterized protein LOC114879350 [Osmia bicornis bicornis]|uniref:uncharacterized protein LOC114879350 n=1 Tax=Osmia bicornis bicornis TaxID=1437191 RepID=UPI0010F7C0EF|nr:uncharacterized protein LOC114879350 [Osmia bicornis bicornis]
MNTTLVGQFRSNMHRRTFVVLQLCSLLAACSCIVAHQRDYDSVSISTDCDQRQNSTECAKKSREIGINNSQTRERVTREIDEKTFEGENEGTEEVTSRKKKDKGYGQMLLYFLGASKLTMLYVLINVVAAIAAKALVVGKAALAIATAIALKKAFEHKEKVTYQIIKHPYHTFENTHSSSIDYDHHGGYEENELGYRKRRRIY